MPLGNYTKLALFYKNYDGRQCLDANLDGNNTACAVEPVDIHDS